MRKLGLLLAVLLASLARAEWVASTSWPVARLAANLARHVEQHPDDADALYALGRVHAWAFCYELERIELWADEGTPIEQTVTSIARYTPTDARPRAFAGQQPAAQRVVPPESLAHLEEAVRFLLRARTLAPERAEVHLSLACVLEHGAHLAGAVDSPTLFGWPAELAPEELARVRRRMQALGDPATSAAAERETLDPAWFERSLVALWQERASANAERQRRAMGLLERWWLARAAEGYVRAFELARGADAALDEKPMVQSGDPLELLVSFEAGQALLRLAGRGVALDEERRGEIERHLVALAELPPCIAVTPLVVGLDIGLDNGLDGCPTLDALVAPGLAVPFDLDGDGREELWPWLAPEAGWLVWDPERSGAITSGRQLFGSRSGWFLFADGYRVLSALDDDGSGELRGPELAGIAVWFDRNSDGISDRGEVVPVEELGIVALATEATERIGASLGNPCGLELADGRILPTYDWVLAPAEPF